MDAVVLSYWVFLTVYLLLGGLYDFRYYRLSYIVDGSFDKVDSSGLYYCINWLGLVSRLEVACR